MPTALSVYSPGVNWSPEYLKSKRPRFSTYVSKYLSADENIKTSIGLQLPPVVE